MTTSVSNALAANKRKNVDAFIESSNRDPHEPSHLNKNSVFVIASV